MSLRDILARYWRGFLPELFEMQIPGFCSRYARDALDGCIAHPGRFPYMIVARPDRRA